MLKYPHLPTFRLAYAKIISEGSVRMTHVELELPADVHKDVSGFFTYYADLVRGQLTLRANLDLASFWEAYTGLFLAAHHALNSPARFHDFDLIAVKGREPIMAMVKK